MNNDAFINTRATFQGKTKSGKADTLTVILKQEDARLLLAKLQAAVNTPDGVKLSIFTTPKEASKFGKASSSITIDPSEPRKQGGFSSGGGQRAFTPKAQPSAPVTNVAPAQTASPSSFGFKPKITVKA